MDRPRHASHADGSLFHAYGGDFGEELHDGTFIADGLLLPDRTPSPGLVELAAAYAPVRVPPVPELPGALELRTRYAFTSTDGARLEWPLAGDEGVVAHGELEGALEPGQSRVVDAAEVVEDALAAPSAHDGALWWVVRAVPRKAPSWASDGFDLGAGQVLVRPAAPRVPARATAARTAEGHHAVGPVVIDDAGHLVRIGRTAVRLARVGAWRTLTDNDARCGWDAATGAGEAWRHASLNRLHERVDRVELDGDTVVVTARTAGAASDCGFAVRYEWRAVDESTADLVVRLTPEGHWPGPVPRLGWLLALEQPEAGQVALDWSGLGPHESYADSARAALAGRWRHTVDELQTRYTHPQENGARRGVTRARLDLAAGPLTLRAGEVQVGGEPVHGIHPTARPWPDTALDAAAHPHELTPVGALWLHVDAAQHGLGSAACGPGVLPNARLRAAPVTLQVRLTIG